MKQPVRIGVRLSDSGYLGRILLGALRAAHERQWIVSMGENAPAFMQRCGILGIIGSPLDLPAPILYQEAGIPFVSALGADVPGCVASVSIDHDEVGGLAAEHLIHRGFRDFGFVGYAGRPGTARRNGFEKAIARRARSFSICPVAYHNTPEEFEAMAAWLRALPKPVGIFAADDPVGGAVTEVCLLSRIKVPSEVAVVSVNDDGVRTLASKPELTSIRIPWERLGIELVNVLAGYIQPRKNETPPKSVVIGPSGIAVRGSSDVLVIGDPEAAAAATFMQQNAHLAISVDNVADATTISRRLLERRFKAATGRTLLEHIHRIRVERAKQMLVDSNVRVSDVAKACGFGTRAQFHRLFHQQVTMTPDEYRKQYQDVASSDLRLQR